MIKKCILIGCAGLFLGACTGTLSKDKLYGEWKYTLVVDTRTMPPDTLSANELKLQDPSIIFTTSDSLLINWGGRTISRGTFTTDGSDIQYTEQLAGDKKRTFPFKVSKLTDGELVFETTGEGATRVTARR